MSLLLDKVNMIDLHCHSHYSDGLLSPDALLQEALNQGVQTLALTDHDTVDGLRELNYAAEGHPIQIIQGIEFTVRWKLHDIHILGLGINPAHETLLAGIEKQKQSRLLRAQEIGLCLEKLGVKSAYEKACTIAGHIWVARPHFAKVLLDEKKVASLKEAFAKYLVRGKPAYVATPWFNLEDVIHCISASGGQSVIAHPLRYKLTSTKLKTLIHDFKHCGGVGIEVVSGMMTFEEILKVARLAQQFELFASSGSDYHGQGMSQLCLGQQKPLPEFCVPIWHHWSTH